MMDFEMARELEIEKYRGYSVVKHNDIIQRARFSLTKREQRIVLYLVSKITESDGEVPKIKLKIKEFCDVCGIGYKENISEIKEVVQKLRDKSMWVTMPNGDEVLMAWLSSARIMTKNGTISVRLQEDMAPYLIQLSKDFTKYELVNILVMDSQYSIRFYELFKSHQFQHIITYHVDDLKRMLMAESYKDYRDFKKRILDVAIAEINKLSDIDVTWEVSAREGRKITELTFRIKRKATNEMIEVARRQKDALVPYVQMKLEDC
jgi:plasmid replication initiation protein